MCRRVKIEKLWPGEMIPLPARPGTIFDRNGLVLAGTIQTKGLFIDPKFMQDFYQSECHSLG